MSWNNQQFNELIQHLIQAVPTGIRQIPQELEHSFRLILQGAFNKMNLLTREEFDVQVAVLRRTREKLEILEKQVKQLQNS